MEIYITTPFIKLEQFLKLSGAVSTGGEAKNIILDGLVSVNGETCLMRGKKLFGGETVLFDNQDYICRKNIRQPPETSRRQIDG